MNWDDMQKVIRAASVLQLSEIAFKGDGESVRLAAIDSKNPTADVFDVVVGVQSEGENERKREE